MHLIEPRPFFYFVFYSLAYNIYLGFDEVRSEQDKLRALESASNSDESSPEFTPEQLTLLPFRAALGTTPCIVAGGYNPSNCWEGIERKEHDAIAFGRYFTSNADLVDRLRTGKLLARYGRS